jgi:hypothetical protein
MPSELDAVLAPADAMYWWVLDPSEILPYDQNKRIDFSVFKAWVLADVPPPDPDPTFDTLEVLGLSTLDTVDLNGLLSGTGSIDILGAINSAGNLSGVDVIASGDVSGVDGTFTGDVTGVNGDFSGNVDAVNVSATGDVSGVNGNFTGDVGAVDGNFSGNVDAATFTGDGSGLTNLNIPNPVFGPFPVDLVLSNVVGSAVGTDLNVVPITDPGSTGWTAWEYTGGIDEYEVGNFNSILRKAGYTGFTIAKTNADVCSLNMRATLALYRTNDLSPLATSAIGIGAVNGSQKWANGNFGWIGAQIARQGGSGATVSIIYWNPATSAISTLSNSLVITFSHPSSMYLYLVIEGLEASLYYNPTADNFATATFACYASVPVNFLDVDGQLRAEQRRGCIWHNSNSTNSFYPTSAKFETFAP